MLLKGCDFRFILYILPPMAQVPLLYLPEIDHDFFINPEIHHKKRLGRRHGEGDLNSCSRVRDYLHPLQSMPPAMHPGKTVHGVSTQSILIESFPLLPLVTCEHRQEVRIHQPESIMRRPAGERSAFPSPFQTTGSTNPSQRSHSDRASSRSHLNFRQNRIFPSSSSRRKICRYSHPVHGFIR